MQAGFESGGIAVDDFLHPHAASEAALNAVHPRAYTELVQRVCAALRAEQVAELPTGDTFVSRHSYAVAMLAAGGALDAVRSASQADPCFALIRPPGHHAEPARGMGFCIFNNIAVAAAWARAHLGNVLIADFDYHHGNGTQAWVEQALDASATKLGFFSTHAYPAYPGTGAFRESQRHDNGFVLDIPLPHSTDTDDFISVWASILPVLTAALQPKVILISAGFDFLAGDPIAGLPVALRAVDALCTLFAATAAQHGSSLAFVLEGGYSLENMQAAGSSFTRNFKADPGHRQAPQPSAPKDERLRRMTEEVLEWFS